MSVFGKEVSELLGVTMEKIMADEYRPVEENLLQYWATTPIGGSGLSTKMQSTLKNMAREVLKSRGIAVKTYEEAHGR